MPNEGQLADPRPTSPGSNRTRTKVRVREREHRRPTWRRTRLRLGISIAGVVLALVVLDLLWAGYTVSRNLSAARVDLEEGAADLVAGDVQGAASQFAFAAGASDAAHSFQRHPTIAALHLIPSLRDDIEAVDRLATAGQLTAEGAGSLAEAADAAGWDGSDAPSISTDGHIDLDALQAALPSLEDARTRFEDAWTELDSVEAGELLGTVQGHFTSARAVLAARASVVATAADLVDLLPRMFGGDHRYLVALTNLSAPRGTGGYFGIYGVLNAVDGQITLTKLEATEDVPRLDTSVELPPDVARRYGRFGMGTTFWATNYSPDFPISAGVQLDVAEAADLGRLDGVISLDTVWTSYVLAALGPVPSSAWPEPISAKTVVPVMNRDTFLIEDEDESNRVQNQIGRDIVQALLDRQPPLEAFSAAMSTGAAERHLQVYTRDVEAEAIIDRLGAAGRFEPGANPLAVVWQDYVASRTGYFVDRRVAQAVTLAADGSAEVATTTSLINGAPAGPPSPLLGSGEDGVPIGYAAMLANVYLPADAESVKMSGGAVQLQEREFDRPVALGLLEADPGASSDFTATYTRPAAATPVGSSLEYRIDYLPQASIRPTATTVRIQVPAGARIESASAGMSIGGDTATYTGTPTRPMSLWVRYAPA